MTDRIKLAEAMGWKYEEVDHEFKYCIRWPDGRREAYLTKGAAVGCLPDPENDANDDYAVLEWMRRENLIKLSNPRSMWNYQIGDYAKAYLKVIDND